MSSLLPPTCLLTFLPSCLPATACYCLSLLLPASAHLPACYCLSLLLPAPAHLPATSFPCSPTGRWRGREVAVKTILFQDRSGEGAGSEAGEMRQRALREAAVCLSISHPNVVSHRGEGGGGAGGP